MIKKITSVLVVDEIEPVLPLWDALEFQRVAEVPHGDKLGFVILVRDGVELMYQTRESIKADEPKCLPASRSSSNRSPDYIQPRYDPCG